MIKERSFFPYLLLIICLLPIAFIIYFNTVGNNFIQDLDNSEEKKFLKKKYRFTTFFSVNNQSFLDTQLSYRNSYNSFKNAKSIFYSDINDISKYINRYYDKNNFLPVFWDNSSDFVFYPIMSIKYNSQSEFENKLEEIFKNNYQDIILRKESIKNSKILNYIYIDYEKNKKILVLISAPLDPDPLYPGNKRMIFTVNIERNQNEISKKYLRSLVINN